MPSSTSALCSELSINSRSLDRRDGWHARDSEPGPQPGVQIMIAKDFAKCRKSRLTGAMARSDVIDLPGVVQARNRPADIGIVGCDKVETTGDQMYPMIDRSRRLHDILDSRMGASDHEHQAIRRFESKR